MLAEYQAIKYVCVMCSCEQAWEKSFTRKNNTEENCQESAFNRFRASVILPTMRVCMQAWNGLELERIKRETESNRKKIRHRDINPIESLKPIATIATDLNTANPIYLVHWFKSIELITAV